MRDLDVDAVGGLTLGADPIANAVLHASVAAGTPVDAFVVRKDPTLTTDALRAFCKENLTGYKVPKQIFFRESLPKTNVGKVLRRALREEVASKR